MFYGGMTNVPGAPGNLMAGSPGYFMPEKEIQDRLFRYGMDNTPAGQQIQQRIQEMRQRYPNVFAPQASTQMNGSSNLPNAINNMQDFNSRPSAVAPLNVPPGFQNKFVS
jgi:hypothetical protein